MIVIEFGFRADKQQLAGCWLKISVEKDAFKSPQLLIFYVPDIQSKKWESFLPLKKSLLTLYFLKSRRKLTIKW